MHNIIEKRSNSIVGLLLFVDKCALSQGAEAGIGAYDGFYFIEGAGQGGSGSSIRHQLCERNARTYALYAVAKYSGQREI
jgi:hypothetical protein